MYERFPESDFQAESSKLNRSSGTEDTRTPERLGERTPNYRDTPRKYMNLPSLASLARERNGKCQKLGGDAQCQESARHILERDNKGQNRGEGGIKPHKSAEPITEENDKDEKGGHTSEDSEISAFIGQIEIEQNKRRVRQGLHGAVKRHIVYNCLFDERHRYTERVMKETENEKIKEWDFAEVLKKEDKDEERQRDEVDGFCKIDALEEPSSTVRKVGRQIEESDEEDDGGDNGESDGETDEWVILRDCIYLDVDHRTLARGCWR